MGAKLIVTLTCEVELECEDTPDNRAQVFAGLEQRLSSSCYLVGDLGRVLLGVRVVEAHELEAGS